MNHYDTIESLNKFPKSLKSLGKGSSRSTRVSDEDSRLDVGKEFCKTGSVVRRGSGRILVDLFNETTEISETNNR